MIEYILQGCQTTIRRARKAHKCCECRGSIFAGENYHYTSGIGDSGPESYKQCVDCVALIKDIDATAPDWEDRICFGGLFEAVDETQYDPYTNRFNTTCDKRGGPQRVRRR